MWRKNDKLSWRKLWVLFKQLPPESATSTALRLAAPPGVVNAEHDPEIEQWSRVEQLLAAIRDEMHFLRWAYGAAHSGKQKPKWKPEPLPRPGVSPRKKKKDEVLSSPQIDLLWQHLNATNQIGIGDDN